MKNIVSLLSMVLVLFFSSCQKEIDWRTSANGPLDDNNGTVLAKYVELDTSLPAGQDTTAVYTFAYDNQKRIKRIIQVQHFTGPAVTYSITTDFFYNGSESLPFKTIELDREGITYVDTSFYTYSSGSVRSDSSINYRIDNNELLFTSVVSFLANGNSVSVKLKESYPGSTYEDSTVVAITRQNGNIVTQQDPNGTVSEDLQMQYDNKVNPFYAVDIRYPILYEHLMNSFGAQKNNVIEETFTNRSITNLHVKYTYTYRLDGYPLTVTIIDLINPSENRKGFFFYTK